MIGSVPVHPAFLYPILFGLFCGSIALCLMIYGKMILCWFSKSAQFKQIDGDIEKAMISLETDTSDEGIIKPTGTTQAQIRSVAYLLDRLEITHPDFNLGTYWHAFLPRLLATSRVGEINEARLIWPGMQNDLRQKTEANNGRR